MNPNDEKKQLSPEEMEVTNILTSAGEQVKQLQQQMHNPPLDRRPYELPPPGMGTARPQQTRDQVKAALTGQVRVIKEAARDKAVKAIEKSQLTVQLKANDKVQRWMNPDIDKDFKQQIKQPKKDISDSQELTMKLLHDQKFKDLKQEMEKGSQNTLDAKHKSGMSMSARFSTSLGYTAMTQGKEKNADKPKAGKEVEPDKEPD